MIVLLLLYRRELTSFLGLHFLLGARSPAEKFLCVEIFRSCVGRNEHYAIDYLFHARGVTELNGCALCNCGTIGALIRRFRSGQQAQFCVVAKKISAIA